MNKSGSMRGFARRRGILLEKMKSRPRFAACLRFYKSFCIFSALGFSCLLTVGLFAAAAYFAVDGGKPRQTLQSVILRYSEPTRFALSPTVFRAAMPQSDTVNYDFLRLRTDTVAPSRAPEIGVEDEPLKTLVPDSDVTVPSGESTAALYAFDRSLVPAGEHAIVPMDLSGQPQGGQILLSNATAFRVDGDAYASRAYPIEGYAREASDPAQPVVLILHTHATECYAPQGMISYAAGQAETRTRDTEKNVVAVGEVLAQTLTDAGIPTLHCETLFDADDYQAAYDNAARAIRTYVSEYPSLRYVFDVHRDALCRENGDEIRPVTLASGQVSAQVMCVVGTNEAGAVHPDWEDHLTVAAHLQSRLNARYPGLARPINLRSAAFNEQYTQGSLLLEIGSFGNTLSEAKTAARVLGGELAAMILEGN